MFSKQFAHTAREISDFNQALKQGQQWMFWRQNILDKGGHL